MLLLEIIKCVKKVKIVLVRIIGTTLIAASFSQAAGFIEFHDMCDNTKTQKCPNIGEEVIILQKFLNIVSDKKIPVTGKWNSATKNAVIAFQKANSVPASGYVGNLTKKALDIRLKEQIAKISPKNATKVTQKKSKKDFVKADKKKKKIAPNKKTDIKNKAKKSAKIDIDKLTTYEAFRRNIDLRKSFAVYKNPKLLSKAGKVKTILKVDVSEQRVKLIVDGKIALSAPCTTGAKHKLEPNTRTYRDKHTPFGTFKIIEKIAAKRSTIFGNYYRHGKLIYHGDRRKYRGSRKGLKFVGAPLYNWMRLTSSGIGLHASSHVKRYPGSNGCIRLPKDVSKMLFSKLKKGTIVKVVN